MASKKVALIIGKCFLDIARTLKTLDTGRLEMKLRPRPCDLDQDSTICRTRKSGLWRPAEMQIVTRSACDTFARLRPRHTPSVYFNTGDQASYMC